MNGYMKNKENIKSTFSNIRPSDEFSERIFAMTIDNKKANKGLTFKKLVSAALVFSLLIGGGFGANAIVQNNKANQPLGVMVAYAGDNGKLSFGNKSPQKTFYGIYLAPSDDEEACKEAIRRWNADKAKILNDLDNKPKGASGNYGSGTFPCYDKETQKETAVFYTVEGGNFSLTLEDYTNVKSFSVENSSEYGLLQFEFALKDEEYDKYPIFTNNNATDEEWEAFEKEHPKFAFQSHEWHLTGDELRYSQENYAECGLGKYKEKKGYFLLWAPSKELQDAIAENPHFDLTQIKDTITFTVEFNDGTVKTASLNLYFDSDGYMCFE